MIRDYHKVTEVIPGGGMVTLKTNKGDFLARKVVMTTGPWGPAMAKRLGIELPFKVLLHTLWIVLFGRGTCRTRGEQFEMPWIRK